VTIESKHGELYEKTAGVNSYLMTFSFRYLCVNSIMRYTKRHYWDIWNVEKIFCIDRVCV